MTHVQIEGMGSLEHVKGRIRSDAFIPSKRIFEKRVPRFLPNIFQIT